MEQQRDLPECCVMRLERQTPLLTVAALARASLEFTAAAPMPAAIRATVFRLANDSSEGRAEVTFREQPCTERWADLENRTLPGRSG